VGWGGGGVGSITVEQIGGHEKGITGSPDREDFFRQKVANSVRHFLVVELAKKV
jgi:hypothetical protein